MRKSFITDSAAMEKTLLGLGKRADQPPVPPDNQVDLPL